MNWPWTRPAEYQYPISRDEIAALYAPLGLREVRLADRLYRVPTLAWINRQMNAATDVIRKHGVFDYAAESNDCDDVDLILGMLKGHNAQQFPGYALPLGRVSYYDVRQQSGHMMFTAIVYDLHGPKVAWLERSIEDVEGLRPWLRLRETWAPLTEELAKAKVMI